MGIQDRDYYREDYAKKNGMVYNTKNATYSGKTKHFPKLFARPVSRPSQRKAPVSEMTSFQAFIWTVAICAVIFLILLLIYKVTK